MAAKSGQQGQWKPGQSGNPGGRANDLDKPITQKLIAALNQAGKKGQSAKIYRLVDALIDEAIDGNIVAIKEILDRVEGRVVPVGDAENSMQVVVVIERHTDEKPVNHPSAKLLELKRTGSDDT